MKITPTLALAAIAAAPVVSAGQFCNDDKSFCVSAVVSGANVTVTYGCKATGWCAFGIGRAMADADIVVGWNNGASFVISDRTATGHALPAFDAVQAVSPVAAPATLDASHTIKISYTRPVAATGADKAFPSGSSSFIYAMSNNAVSDPTSASSTFTQHNGGHSPFSADLSSQSSTGTGNSTATRPSTTTATAKASPTKSSAAVPGTTKTTAGSLFFGLLSAILFL
ncbi:hypothetical protein BJ742DRAFT_843698 [Cladochytrium replicatum]|nr:hypothetical protein BJ742DRAFT_843698 [Cladochytrium replicatum]